MERDVRRIYRVRVTDNGGDEPRDLVPEAAEMEADTGAWEPVQFWPPHVGATRHYLSLSGAKGRAAFWAENGVTSVIEPSLPVVWGDS
jgi:hypothetical protein